MNLETGVKRRASAASPASPRWQSSGRKLRSRLLIMLLTLDCLCIVGSFLLANFGYRLVFDGSADANQGALVSAVILPVYLALALNVHAYSPEVISTPSRGIGRALRALGIAAGSVLLFAFYLKASLIFSRATFGLGFLLSFVTIGFARNAFLRKASHILGGNPFSVILITDSDHQIPLAGFSIIVPGSNFDLTTLDPAMFDRLAHTVKDADRVIVTCSMERRSSWAAALKGANVQAEIIIPELVALAPLGMEHWHGLPTLVVADGALDGIDAAIKRLFDVVVAGTALILLSPLLLIISVLIKLESRGPVFFVQTRIGQANRQFRMFKFRSMRVDALDHNANMLTKRGDSRVTAVGSFIRASSIDELPQLLNVLQGPMSIVGPRPHALGARAADKLYWEVDERYFHRHAAKPGLTGLAQVRGFRGNTEHEQDLTDRLQADLEYLNHWSIWKDIKILLMTVRVVFHHNAY